LQTMSFARSSGSRRIYRSAAEGARVVVASSMHSPLTQRWPG
jgi:hypothetical protein